MGHSSLNLPPMDSLIALLVIAARGSFTAAADELAVTHGALSRRIRGLEAWLGQPVFERHARGATLTPSGEILARHVERSLGAIASARETLRPLPEPGCVKVSALPSVARLWLLPHFHIFRGSPPDLRILIASEHRCAKLDDTGADLAIRTGAGSWKGLEAHLLFEETLRPAAAPALARRCNGMDAGALTQLPLIHDSDISDWQCWMREHGLNYRIKRSDLRFDDYDLALEAAANGGGIVLARDPLADGYLSRGRLILLPGAGVIARRQHFVVMRQGEQRDSVRRLAERLLRLGRSA